MPLYKKEKKCIVGYDTFSRNSFKLKLYWFYFLRLKKFNLTFSFVVIYGNDFSFPPDLVGNSISYFKSLCDYLYSSIFVTAFNYFLFKSFLIRSDISINIFCLFKLINCKSIIVARHLVTMIKNT